MSLKHGLLGISLLGIAACGGSGDSNYDSYSAEPTPAPIAAMKMQGMAVEMDEAFPADMPIEPGQAQPAPDAPQQYIAYRHAMGMILPKGGVDQMMQGHMTACQQAGTQACIVINSNINSEDEDYASGYLSLRATPAWIETFMGGLDAEAEEAGGEISERSTSAEDLTRQIVDTGARLEAQKTLQGRLMGLLERRDGNLGDLLQIERELARVTGEIESIEAQLKTLRLRVSMSSLDLNYRTKVPAFSATRENPLGEAFGDFFYNFSAAIASVVTAFAVGLPWIVLIGIFLWIWLRLIWPRLRRKKKTS